MIGGSVWTGNAACICNTLTSVEIPVMVIKLSITVDILSGLAPLDVVNNVILNLLLYLMSIAIGYYEV
jgi:hypothetical protein